MNRRGVLKALATPAIISVAPAIVCSKGIYRGNTAVRQFSIDHMQMLEFIRAISIATAVPERMMLGSSSIDDDKDLQEYYTLLYRDI